MKKSAKIALAVASVWPFVWMLIFIMFFFGMMFFMSSHSKMDDRHQGMPLPIILLFAGHFATMVFIFALTAFYVVYLFKTNRVPQDKKALWAVVLFFANIFAFPIFWYLYIWKEPSAMTGG